MPESGNPSRVPPNQAPNTDPSGLGSSVAPWQNGVGSGFVTARWATTRMTAAGYWCAVMVMPQMIDRCRKRKTTSAGRAASDAPAIRMP